MKYATALAANIAANTATVAAYAAHWITLTAAITTINTIMVAGLTAAEIHGTIVARRIEATL